MFRVNRVHNNSSGDLGRPSVRLSPLRKRVTATAAKSTSSSSLETVPVSPDNDRNDDNKDKVKTEAKALYKFDNEDLISKVEYRQLVRGAAETLKAKSDLTTTEEDRNMCCLLQGHLERLEEFLEDVRSSKDLSTLPLCGTSISSQGNQAVFDALRQLTRAGIANALLDLDAMQFGYYWQRVETLNIKRAQDAELYEQFVAQHGVKMNVVAQQLSVEKARKVDDFDTERSSSLKLSVVDVMYLDRDEYERLKACGSPEVLESNRSKLSERSHWADERVRLMFKIGDCERELALAQACTELHERLEGLTGTNCIIQECECICAELQARTTTTAIVGNATRITKMEEAMRDMKARTDAKVEEVARLYETYCSELTFQEARQLLLSRRLQRARSRLHSCTVRNCIKKYES